MERRSRKTHVKAPSDTWHRFSVLGTEAGAQALQQTCLLPSRGSRLTCVTDTRSVAGMRARARGRGNAQEDTSPGLEGFRRTSFREQEKEGTRKAKACPGLEGTWEGIRL